MIFAKSELHHISNLLDWVDNSIKKEQKMKNKQQSSKNTKIYNKKHMNTQ